MQVSDTQETCFQPTICKKKDGGFAIISCSSIVNVEHFSLHGEYTDGIARPESFPLQIEEKIH